MTDDGLQFDRAEGAGPPSGGVACVACKQPILDQYFSARGQPVCRACRDRISNQLAAAAGNLPKGIVFGIGGALAGAVIYFAVAAIAKVEIGLAHGKQTHDKRDTIAKRDNDRELRRVLKERY